MKKLLSNVIWTHLLSQLTFIKMINNIVPPFVFLMFFRVFFFFFQQCKKDLHSCLKAGEDKKVCFKKYKACMTYALVRPYVVSLLKTFCITTYFNYILFNEDSSLTYVLV